MMPPNSDSLRSIASELRFWSTQTRIADWRFSRHAFMARQPNAIIAVTGTNGKTSVVHFVREIWTAMGLAAGSLGTLGLVTADEHRPGALTTPDPLRASS